MALRFKRCWKKSTKKKGNSEKNKGNGKECWADTRLLVFTYDNGIKTLYNDNAGQSSYYKGYGCVLRTWGHMGYATWDELTYNGSTITSTKVFEEDINGTNRDYTEPHEKYIDLYPLTNKQPILNVFKTE